MRVDKGLLLPAVFSSAWQMHACVFVYVHGKADKSQSTNEESRENFFAQTARAVSLTIGIANSLSLRHI